MSELAEEATRIIADEAEYREPPSSGPKKKRGRKAKIEAEPTFVYQRNEASVKACTILGAVVMRIVCRLSKWEPLTEEEELELGAAIDPVVQKRLPMLTNWGEEMGLAMVLMGVIAPRALAGSQEIKPDDVLTYRDAAGEEVIEIKPDSPKPEEDKKPPPVESSW